LPGCLKNSIAVDHYYSVEQAGTNALLTHCAAYKDDDVVLSDIAKVIVSLHR